jgi:hypothetical protein
VFVLSIWFRCPTWTTPNCGSSNEHLGRRHFSDEQKSYWRFKLLEYQKKPVVRDDKGHYTAPGGQNDLPGKTALSIAQQHRVSESTVKRDAQYGRAVDTIAAAAGKDAKKAILTHAVKMTRQETRQFAGIEGIAGPEPFRPHIVISGTAETLTRWTLTLIFHSHHR